jgi:transcriptional regulator with XRE-family HTH domain
MDVSRNLTDAQRNATLSQALKQIRARRGFRSAEVARQMDVSLRNYQRFEKGELGLDLEKIFGFCEVVRADPWGIVFAAEFGSVSFALYCMENQAISLLLTMLRRFDRLAGQDIAALDPRSVALIFRRAFEQISLRAQEFHADLEQWMFDETFGDPDDED